MQIRIDSLSVNGLGPIASIKWQFQDINLVYGRNEQGKTFLVEYLLSSLFKKSSKTRPLTDSGQVNISGLIGTGTRFYPKSKKKLEDYLFIDDKLVDLSRLLVVKAGETKFSQGGEKGITKSILKDYLSDQHVLDSIFNKIPANIQKSSWHNGQLILGQKSGDCKTYENLLNELQQIDELLAEVDEKYTLGEISKEKLKLEEVDRLIQIQEQARKYTAYQKDSKIKALSEKLQQLPQIELDDIKLINNQVHGLKTQIQKDKQQISELELRCAHFHWLETAIAECEKRPEAVTLKSDLFFIILGAVLIFVTTGLAFLQMSWWAMASGVLALLLFFFMIRHYRSKLQQSDGIAEIKRIFSSFEMRFNQKAHSITDLKSKYTQLQPDYYSLEPIKAQLINNQIEFNEKQKMLKDKLSKLLTHFPDFDDLNNQINQLQKKRDELEEALNNEKNALSALGVVPDDYYPGPVDTQFNHDELNNLYNQKNSILCSINEWENNLQALKQRVCAVTRSDINSEWDKIINNLRNYRVEVSQSLKASKAKIGSGIVVTNVIEEIRNREDEVIAKALTANKICEPIKALTHIYQGIEMEGDDIIVFSDHERYPIHHLSTGAQEQILLALRIGLAAHYLKNNKMFLILDDAFQHSDWERREWLVDQMADLASIGWQIIYFAMDDHIKQLFEQRLKPKFKHRYAAFELAK